MITITIKGLSKTAHRALKQRAATHGRSLNTEAIAVLEASVQSAPTDAGAALRRAREFRNSLQLRVAPAAVKRFTEAGRA